MGARNSAAKRNLDYSANHAALSAISHLETALAAMRSGWWDRAADGLGTAMRKASIARRAAVKRARMDGEGGKGGADAVREGSDGDFPAED